MTYLTKCEPCKRGDHDHHERQVDPLTPEQIEAGVLGGGVCVCECTKTPTDQLQKGSESCP